MFKIKPYIRHLCLHILLLGLLTHNAQAIPIGGFFKFFKGLSKGTKAIKPGAKITSSGSIDDIIKKIDEPNLLNNNKILDKNSTHNDILEAHGVKRVDKIADGIDIIETGNESFSNNDDSNLILKFFLYTPKSIYPRIIREVNQELESSNQSRLIIDCESDNHFFTFTVLFSKDANNWLLLSRYYQDTKLKDIPNINNSTNIFFSKQKLKIIEINDEYILFSDTMVSVKNNPSNYFIMSANEKFAHIDNTFGLETPIYIKNIARAKIGKSNSICLKKKI